jgi:uncharacterized protein (TIGR00725 family)
MYIAVIGASKASAEEEKLAAEVGQFIGKAGHTLVCGGLGGVMNAAAKGAQQSGGISVGILPGYDRSQSSPYLTVSIPTGLSHGRNFLVVLSADALIAIGGEYGTLSEISFALKLKKPLVLLKSWTKSQLNVTDAPVVEAKTAKEAWQRLQQLLAKHTPNSALLRELR